MKKWKSEKVEKVEKVERVEKVEGVERVEGVGEWESGRVEEEVCVSPASEGETDAGYPRKSGRFAQEKRINRLSTGKTKL